MASCFCAWGSTVIRLHAWQSKFIPDGEGTSAPSPQSGQRSPGLAVGDSACWFTPGRLSHGDPAGNNRPQGAVSHGERMRLGAQKSYPGWAWGFVRDGKTLAISE